MIAQSMANILRHHVKLSVEGIDRMFLNVMCRGCRPNKGLYGSSANTVANLSLPRR